MLQPAGYAFMAAEFRAAGAEFGVDDLLETDEAFEELLNGELGSIRWGFRGVCHFKLSEVWAWMNKAG